MPTILTNGIQLPDKGSVDWYSSMQSNYNLIDAHLGDTDVHVTAEDKANWDSKQGSLSQAQLDAIAQVATNTSDIATLQSGKANASHTHSSSDITDIGDYATKQYVDNSISGLVDSAPNALDTLNELAAALNDDANFASTVTTALATKANSADLATVATSGDYNDLDNLPTIPTKTSDLTNDSNFVDTSNTAISSGITSAKVTDYDAHIADNDIHVTTTDKNKWNNNVTQSYVLRYSSASVTDNSTIAYSTLDNTDNIKASDKVIDVDGKIFSVVSVDTTNQTVTVGTALIDLALDANVMHLSGVETVAGIKTFSDIPIFATFDGIRFRCAHNSSAYVTFRNQNQANPGSIIFSANDGNVGTVFHLVNKTLIPYTNGDIDLGTSLRKWKSLNGINPGALCFPDLSNGIDISGYLDTSQSSKNYYTPSVNGWISIKGRSSSVTNGIIIMQGDFCQMGQSVVDFDTTNRVSFCMLPVMKNVQVEIWLKSVSSLDSAKFYPCQGNV